MPKILARVPKTSARNFEVENIKLNPELAADKQQEILKRCLNEAREDIQKKLAKVMMSSGIGF